MIPSITYHHFIDIFENPIFINVLQYISGCDEFTGPATRKELIHDLGLSAGTVNLLIKKTTKLGITQNLKIKKSTEIHYLFNHDRYNELKFIYNQLKETLDHATHAKKGNQQKLDIQKKALRGYSQTRQSEVLQLPGLAGHQRKIHQNESPLRPMPG